MLKWFGLYHRTGHLFFKGQKMSDKEAMNLIEKVCAAYHGNFADHQILQEALSVIRAKVYPKQIGVEVPKKVTKKRKPSKKKKR